MAKALSIDLRKRVVATIAAGMSRRQAAKRFGVSAANAVRWQKQFGETGTVQSDKQGGDRRSKRIDAHATTILTLYEATPDINYRCTKAKLRMALGNNLRMHQRQVSLTLKCQSVSKFTDENFFACGISDAHRRSGRSINF